MRLPKLLLAGIEIALNRYLRLDPATLARLARLTGKVVALEVHGTGLTLYLAPGAGGIQLLGGLEREPDAIISGAPFSLARAGLQAGQRDALHAGDVQVRGDVDVGREVEEILRSVDIDWEEQLSHFAGDVTAHQVGNVVRGANTWREQTQEILAQNIAEYLQEESRHLPRREEVEAFLSQVDVLRSDADRLSARVRRLHDWLAQPESEG